MANKILLPNGCSMSQPSVNPKNWKTGGNALLKKDWYIQYYFYDPEMPKPKLVIVKGMNEFKNLGERKEITQHIIEDEIINNKRGYNPFLKEFVVNNNFKDQELHPNLPFINAFRIALERFDCSEDYYKETFFALNKIESEAKKKNYDIITISKLTRRTLRVLLTSCNISDTYFNKYRSFLSSLFNILIEHECCDTNLIRDIAKKKIVKKVRKTLTEYELTVVLEYLKVNYYNFWRYTMIFLYSGSRSTEMFSVQAKNVDIANQEYKVIIKKGKHYKEVTKVILKEVIPLWEELISISVPEDYIFAKGLEPGAAKIQSYQITKRWYRLVKKSDKIVGVKGEVLNIEADFYALKHKFLDTLPIDLAQAIASHTTAKTTQIYRVSSEKKLRTMLKDLDVSMN